MGYCVMYARRVGVSWDATSSVWAATSSVWDVAASVCGVKASCGLMCPLTLVLTMVKAQCRAKNSNPAAVAAACPVSCASLSSITQARVGLRSNPRCNRPAMIADNEDGELRQGTKTDDQEREPKQGTNTENQERESEAGSENREPMWEIKTGNQGMERKRGTKTGRPR